MICDFKIIKKITALFLICYFLSCNKVDPVQQDFIPINYTEMFAALNLQFDVLYNYVELINNQPTGNRGTIKFILTDTSMVESYNSQTTKDYFRLDSLKSNSAKFESWGRNKYSANNSCFINNAWQSISYVNGSSMVSFGTTSGGSYYFYQYLLFR